MRVVDHSAFGETSPPLNNWRKLVMWKCPRCWLLLVSLFLRSARVSLSRRNRHRRRRRRPSRRKASQLLSARRAFRYRRINSPARVSVIPAEDMEQKQIERVADALREVPGLSVVQTGAPGQLTSVFTRGLRANTRRCCSMAFRLIRDSPGAFNFAT